MLWQGMWKGVVKLGIKDILFSFQFFDKLNDMDARMKAVSDRLNLFMDNNNENTKNNDKGNQKSQRFG